MTQLSVLKLALLCILPSLATAVTEFTIAPNGVSCSDYFTADLGAECGGGEGICTWGSEVRVNGIVTITNELPGSGSATGVVKAFGAVTLYEGDVEFCGCMESDSATCPESGSYTLNEFPAFHLPGDDSAFYANSGYFGASVPISAKFTFSDGSTATCTTSVVLSNNRSGMAAGALVLLGLATALGIRRRRVATIQLREDEGTKSHFEMMPNGDSVQV